MVARVFWPSPDLARIQQSFQTVAVGWQNGTQDFVVAAVLPFLDVAAARQLVAETLAAGHLASERLRVLGTCASAAHTDGADDLAFAYTLTNKARGIVSIEFTPSRTDGVPNGAPKRASSGEPAQVVLYDPPNDEWLRYYSLEPIRLGLYDTSQLTVVSAEHEPDLVQLREHRRLLRGRAEDHARDDLFEAVESCSAARRPRMDRVLQQLNASHRVARQLRADAKRLFPEQARAHAASTTHAQGRARRLSRSAHRLGREARRHAERSIYSQFTKLAWLFVAAAVAMRYFAEALLLVLDRRVWKNYKLREVSATAMQLDIMLKRLSYYPEQYLVVRKRPRPAPTAEYSVEYIRFYNSLWLRLNDRLLAYSATQLILAHQFKIFDAVLWMTQIFFGYRYRQTVHWLMSWPGGLKLHDELAAFIGGVVLWVITAWQALLLASAPLIKAAIVFVAYAGYVGGLSLQIALVSDLISLFTLQVFWFYMASARVYRNVLLVLASLFRLFRGKKYNVLRKRVDSGGYDFGQLLMGTFIFTILLFLLPTIATFYFAFASMRFILVGFSAGLEMVLMFLNHFPIFIMLLRLKSPGRIPGGVRLECVSTEPPVLRLVSRPLDMRRIFHQFNVMAQRFIKHYFSGHVLVSALTGRQNTIQRTAMYNLLNSMLPKVRTPVAELYWYLCRELDLSPELTPESSPELPPVRL